MQTSNSTLQPKELFPLAPNSSASACGPIDHRIEEYNYCTPLEKHLNNLMNEVEMKETESMKLRCQINSLSECTLPKGQLDDDPGHYYCSWCHESGHKKNKCTGQKCVTFVSCGLICLHKDEMKEIDVKRADLKKILKEKAQLENECKKTQEKIRNTWHSFPQAVKSHLINSNKPKYLTMFGESVVPLTKVINIDLTILQKHYGNRVPSNLSEESKYFQTILESKNDTIKNSTSLNAKVLDSVKRLDNHILGPDRHAPSDSSRGCTPTPTTFAWNSPPAPLSMTSPKPPPNTPTTFPPYIPLDHLGPRLGRMTEQFGQLGSPEHLITTKWGWFSNGPSFSKENGSVVSEYAGNTPTSSYSKPIDKTCTMQASNSGNLAKNAKDTPTNTGYIHATQPNSSSFNYVTYKSQECGGERLTKLHRSAF